ncbi:MAG: hypothetical protein OEY67_04670, partial [Gammaproteobacteria bacterium]|nr:hypothetical protein [Gammaproteobacteria bacterium]
TQFGYHLIKLTDYKPSVKLPFAKVKEKIKELALKQKAEERFYDVTESFHNLTFENPDSLKPAADALDLKIKQSGWFARTGGAGIAANPKVLDAAFNPEVLEQGRNSEVIELSETSLVSLRVMGHRKQEPMPLAQVRSQIVAQLKQQSALERASALRDSLTQTLQAGGDLKKQAASHNLKYSEAKALRRNQTGEVDSRIVKAVFQAKRPEAGQPVFGSVDLGNAGYAVFVLQQIREGDPARADAKTKESISGQLTGYRGVDYLQYYSAGLRQEANVRIFADNL